jgi:hypothetical protein
MAAPKRGTRRYKAVLDAGCGGKYDYWGEFDCDHEYDWTCDDCPINAEHHYQAHGKEIDVIEIDLEELFKWPI